MTDRIGTHRKIARLACLVVPLLAAHAQAGDWKVTNSLQLSTFVSDNLSHRSDGNAGAGLTVQPRIGLRGSGRRISGGLAYAPTLVGYVGEDPPQDRLSHLLNAAFHSELVRQTLFVDASASASLVNTSGLASGSDPATTVGDEGRQTYTLSVSPYSRHRFGSYATLTLRAGLNTVRAESEASDLDSTGRSLSAVLGSGARFTRLPWSLLASHSETEYSDASQSSQVLRGSLGYRFNRQWRLDGSLGYEEQDVFTTRGDTSGMTYSGTVRWTPNPRTNAEFELGQRYFGTFWRGRAQHRSRRSLFTMDVAREVTNVRSILTRPLTEDEIDQIAELNDLNDAQRELLRQFGVAELLNEDFLSTRVAASLQLTGRRTSVSLRSDWSRREYEVTPREDTTLGLAVSATRQLSAGMSASAGATWQSVDSSAGIDSEYTNLSLGVSRTLGRYSRVGVNLSRQERTTSGGGDGFVEHRAGVTFSTRMF